MSMRKVMETGCVTRAARCDERASRYPNVDAGLAQTAIHGIFFRARLSSIKSRAIFDEFLHDMIAC
ncbi:hypothetical protein [Burkholderia pseudomallei]|uniref:hypothetical protein n=1 Tax=Burkholderia pseudomallei TaxID=28450 RepID=UPI0039851514